MLAKCGVMFHCMRMTVSRDSHNPMLATRAKIATSPLLIAGTINHPSLPTASLLFVWHLMASSTSSGVVDLTSDKHSSDKHHAPSTTAASERSAATTSAPASSSSAGTSSGRPSSKEELAAIDDEIEELETQIVLLRARLSDLHERRDAIQRLIPATEAAPTTAAAAASSTELGFRDQWASGRFAWDKAALDTLKGVFKCTNGWRPLQREVINCTLSGQDGFVILPTGAGKSVCYQLPAVLALPGSAMGGGITLVVSPLVSLVTDQLMALRKLGIGAATVNSATSTAQAKRIHQRAMGQDDDGDGDGASSQPPLRLLYVTPEKIAKSKRFLSRLQKIHEAG